MRKLTLQEFIDKANIKHNYKYDYSKAIYKDSKIKITIICGQHGEFSQLPALHLGSQGCFKCGVIKRANTQQANFSDFKDKAGKIHNNKYLYNEIDFISYRKHVGIICPKHGKFYQAGVNHLRGRGCKKCFTDKISISIEEFIDKANIIHNNKYDYSKVIYVNKSTKITIICPKHG